MPNLISFEKFKDYWEDEPIVVIDTCSLFDLYRIAPKGSRAILKNLWKVEKNIWIPNQVLEEYYRNKKRILKTEHSKFKNVSKEAVDLVTETENELTKQFLQYGKFQYPKINKFQNELEEILCTLKEKAKSFDKKVAKEIVDNKDTLLADEVNDFINRIKDRGQYGSSFSYPDLLEIYREGEFRYAYDIPPGYDDKEKTTNKLIKFGDLIVWKEILEKSKENYNRFIFITEDATSDWWEKEKKSNSNKVQKIIGPRKELIKEFEAHSQIGGEGFLMLNLQEFNKHISKINEVNVKEAYLDNIEINPEEELKVILEKEDWHDLIDRSGELTTILRHDSVLEDHLEGFLVDVEILDISYPLFEDLHVDSQEDEIIIEGIFTSDAFVNITTEDSNTNVNLFEKEFSFSGYINVEYKLIYNDLKESVYRKDISIENEGFTFE